MKKKIDVIITSWLMAPQRFDYLKKTIESMKKHLRFGDWDNQYHLGLETHGKIHCEKELYELCEKHNVIIHRKETPPSLSSALNFANGLGDSNLILFNQDDFKCVMPLDIGRCADHLISNEKDYVIRLIWRNEFQNRLLPCDIPWLVRLDPAKKGYLFTDNPHVRKRTYVDCVGGWPDSMETGEDGRPFDNGRCENKFNAIAKKIAEDHRILAIKEEAFIHIGRGVTTLQDKKFNRIPLGKTTEMVVGVKYANGDEDRI